jgi:hypothetical protein
MTEAQAIAALNDKPDLVRVLFESSTPKTEKRSAYSERTISVANVTCAGVDAEVRLSFYLGKLREVTCLPSDMNKMMNALRATKTVDIKEPRFDVNRADVEIRGQFIEGRWGVSFTSTSLTREQAAWVRENS